jgi:hypothetical protein
MHGGPKPDFPVAFVEELAVASPFEAQISGPGVVNLSHSVDVSKATVQKSTCYELP